MMDPLAQRKQENIAGYVIGMWQVEDLMRALELDLQQVEDRLIATADGDEAAKAALREWYRELIVRMRAEGLERIGHLGEVEEVMNELEHLHEALLEAIEDEAYQALFDKAKAGITAVYGVMMLRSQGKEISQATLADDHAIRELLDRLSLHYRQMRRLPGVSLN